MTVTMSLALLILRLVVGLTLAVHGAQKLFGWFAGPGLTRLIQGFEKQRFKPATFKSHWKNGFIISKGGYEYTLVLMAVSITIGLMGPGNFSLDALFGIVLPEVLLFGVLAVAAIIVDIIGLLISRPTTVEPSGGTARTS